MKIPLSEISVHHVLGNWSIVVLETNRMKDANFNNDSFYVPVDEDISKLSGIVVVLCGEFPDPTSAISFISKKEDVAKVRMQCFQL